MENATEKFTDYTIKRETDIEFADHETHLSFNSDWQSVAFQEWLHAEGMKHFAEWLEIYREDFK